MMTSADLQTQGEAAAEELPPAFRVADLWQGSVTEASGFAAIPMALLRLQATLKLSATDLLVLINLLAHRWKPGDGVFPRTTIIAKRMGVSARTVQRSIDKAEKQGLVRRDRNDAGLRTYHFDGLVARLARDTPYSLKIKGTENLGHVAHG